MMVDIYYNIKKIGKTTGADPENSERRAGTLGTTKKGRGSVPGPPLDPPMD